MKRVPFFLFLFALLAPSAVTYRVRLMTNEGGQIVEMPAEQYVAAVLAGESSTFRSNEALKAMAVAARTYAARMRGRHRTEGYDFCGTTHCQRIQPANIASRLTSAAHVSAGELLWFEGKLAFTVYSRNCGGKSEAANVVWPDLEAPYLRVHTDSYCTRHGDAIWSWMGTADSITRALLGANLRVPPNLMKITIRDRTGSGRAKTLQLKGNAPPVLISAGSFRFAVGRAFGWNRLRSESYELQNGNGGTSFRGRGAGHGVGLCQDGADEMGTEGFTYRQILEFYYPGTTVGTTAKGIRWTRLGGEGVAVFTTLPNQDNHILRFADELRISVERQLGLSTNEAIDIRVYPDLDTFRNATGEPGWVAARSSRFGIDLQPSSILESRGVLRSTLRHELLHVVMEREAVSGLPLPFREGLVEWLSQPHPFRPLPTQQIEVSSLGDRENSARARYAYSAAYGRVAKLINHYGEATVVGWLQRGLPLEVRNSMVSNAATNSK